MKLNTLSPAIGSKQSKKRVGRGIGSGLGKTCGKGHKGQLARSGAKKRLGFEGGQMPIQRRLPKFGFISQGALTHEEIRLANLEKLPVTDVSLAMLKVHGLIKANTSSVKIFLQGEITRPYSVTGIRVSKGAKAAIEACGGTVHSEG